MRTLIYTSYNFLAPGESSYYLSCESNHLLLKEPPFHVKTRNDSFDVGICQTLSLK